MGKTRGLRSFLLGAEANGRADVKRYREAPGSIRSLRLARFDDSSLRGLLLRRLLLRLRISAVLLAPLTELMSTGLARQVATFLESLAYWQGVRDTAGLDWERLLRPPVILMYHAVGSPDEAASRYVTGAKQFAAQMGWLRRSHLRIRPLDELVSNHANGRLSLPSSVAITFDDGYYDNLSNAAPVLSSFSFPATIFVVTRRVGAKNDWDQGAPAGRSLLAWQDLVTCEAAGLRVGCHGSTHRLLPELDEAALESELSDARRDLELHLGHARRCFAYPHGRFDERAKAAVERVGFSAACCSLGGTNEPWVPLYEMRRVEIKGTDSKLDFVLTVILGRRITLMRLISKLVFGG